MVQEPRRTARRELQIGAQRARLQRRGLQALGGLVTHDIDPMRTLRIDMIISGDRSHLQRSCRTRCARTWHFLCVARDCEKSLTVGTCLSLASLKLVSSELADDAALAKSERVRRFRLWMVQIARYYLPPPIVRLDCPLISHRPLQLVEQHGA
jgi:hypothetical protein